MNELPIDGFRHAIRKMHGSESQLVDRQRNHEIFEGETVWHDLKSALTDSIFVWDTTTVADGRYVIRVVASDEPANSL